MNNPLLTEALRSHIKHRMSECKNSRIDFVTNEDHAACLIYMRGVVKKAEGLDRLASEIMFAIKAVRGALGFAFVNTPEEMRPPLLNHVKALVIDTFEDAEKICTRTPKEEKVTTETIEIKVDSKEEAEEMEKYIKDMVQKMREKIEGDRKKYT